MDKTLTQSWPTQMYPTQSATLISGGQSGHGGKHTYRPGLLRCPPYTVKLIPGGRNGHGEQPSDPEQAYVDTSCTQLH